jgi:hypothetical protein
MQVSANGILLEVEDRGPTDGPPLVMIMGLGMQLVPGPRDSSTCWWRVACA